VQAAGLRCVPLPGASSVPTLISVAGLASQDGLAAFEFTGFLPPKGREREQALLRLVQQAHACVLLEAPHRIATLARDLAPLGERAVTVGRELTKQFEEIATVPCAALHDWLQASPQRSKGEFALVLHPVAPNGAASDGPSAEELRVLDLLLAEMPLKSAARLAADITGGSKNALYQAGLARKQPSPTEGRTSGPRRQAVARTTRHVTAFNIDHVGRCSVGPRPTGTPPDALGGELGKAAHHGRWPRTLPPHQRPEAPHHQQNQRQGQHAQCGRNGQHPEHQAHQRPQQVGKKSIKVFMSQRLHSATGPRRHCHTTPLGGD